MAQCLERIAYGKLYVSGYAGILYCYDVKTGDLLWTYGNGGEGNSTSSGFVTPYGRYPIFISTIADGKVYSNHNRTLTKLSTLQRRTTTRNQRNRRNRNLDNHRLRQPNVRWSISSRRRLLNCPQLLRRRIYCIGKGPSALTVTAPNIAATSGTPSCNTRYSHRHCSRHKTNEQAARFPNGVPAVSDASQAAWMEYVYMQKPKPTDVTGVPITIRCN